jgi:transposase-like protein
MAVPPTLGPFRIPTPRDIERLAFEGRVSMETLCRRAGVNSSTFRYWRLGRSSPSVGVVQALLDAGLAAMAEAEKAEAQGATAKPVRARRKQAAAKRAPRAKSAALKRPARRRA